MHNPQTVGSRELCLRLMRYVAPYWEALLLALLCLGAMAATMPLLALLVQLTLDGIFIGRNPDLMQVIPLGIIALFLVRGLTGQIGAYAIGWVGNQLACDLRGKVFSKLMFLPVSRYSRDLHIRLVSMATFYPARIARAFIDVSTVLVRDSLIVAGLLAWAFYLDWALASLMLITASVILLMRQLVVKRIQGMEMEAGKLMEALERLVRDSVENHRMVKLHSAEQHESRRVKEQAESLRGFVTKKMMITSLWIPVIQLAAAIALATIIYLAAGQVLAEEITAGVFASLLVAMLLLIAPLKRMIMVNGTLQRGLSDAGKLFLLLEQESERDRGAFGMQLMQGELRFERVGYEEEHGPASEPMPKADDAASAEAGTTHYPLLHDITFTVRTGEIVALVGFPGSTAALANMIPRFADPTSGRILLGGQDLRNLPLASLRSSIAWVSKEAMLFNDTIAANIAYGAGGRATEAMITAVAHAANVSEFLRRLPQGLQTVVGEDGVELDLGQKLRIAVARALLKDAPILILEEPGGTDKAVGACYPVRAALENVMRGRTTVVIGNCLRTLEKADRIIVLDKGRIVATGNHRELLARDGRYARFIQTLGVSESEGDSRRSTVFTAF